MGDRVSITAHSASPASVPKERFRLPRQLIPLYLVAPILTAPIFMPGIFEESGPGLLVKIAGSYVPFLAIPAAIHPFYAHVVPRLFARLRLQKGHLVVHALLSAVVASVVALAIHPVHGLFYPQPAPLLAWIANCVVITWAFLLPALIVLELRARAHAVERCLLEERQAALKAQIEAILSRTNPHFLFNSLNTIASLIPDDPKLAETTLERLSDLLRYALQNVQAEQIALGKELRMLEDYLEVQRARFGDRLHFRFDVEPGLEEMPILPLMLQPLVENAVLHGVSGRVRGGTVVLSARRQGIRSGKRVVEFRVEDDGPGPGGSSHRGSGTSLGDLRTRIAVVYGTLAELTTGANERGGFTARLLVPFAGTP
jgi:two-component system, LytTR family, sensor histidine kinase AlgZ